MDAEPLAELLLEAFEVVFKVCCFCVFMQLKDSRSSVMACQDAKCVVLYFLDFDLVGASCVPLGRTGVGHHGSDHGCVYMVTGGVL